MNEIDLSFIDAIKKKKPKSKYQKPDSVKGLERLHFEAKKLLHPNNPAVLKPIYRDDCSNGIAKCVITWLKLNGCSGSRINSTGLYDPRLGKYRPSGAKKGVSDIIGIKNGKFIAIEIKVGRDKMRSDQLKYKAEVEDSGGVYLIVHSFDDFLNQINEI